MTESSSRVLRIDTPDGESLAVHVLGDGEPLLCVPGGPARASAYLEDLAGLSDVRRLLRVDLRGTGLSPLPADRGSLAFHRLADDLDVVRESQGLETVDVIAHSAGGFVTLAYAAKYPHRLGRVVLVTPSAKPFGDVEADIAAIRASRSGEPWYAEAAAVEAELELMPPRMRQRFDPSLRVFGYARWDDRARAHADSTDGQMSMRAMAAFAPDAETAAELNLVEKLKGVAAPVLIIVGSLDGMTGVKAGHLIADMLPNASVVELPDAAHYPWIDSPESFRDAVVSFLAAG
ncbi:MAG TPA: alpha/beta hydrolase [Mycobacteriales bacterium]|nr:alpha/beta hydrolase [Mycobacteriales bacterium]